MEMSRTRSALVLFAAALLLLAGQAWAQNPTGTLTGRVNDEDGGALPGVTVTAESPSLQGTRTTTTEGNGAYKLAFLPPGVYQVSYALEGFNTSVREVKMSAAQTTPSNITLQIGTVAEAIVVTSDSVAMTSEACATGKPVFVIELPGGSLKFERFHDALAEAGCTRPFTDAVAAGGLETWRYTPLGETASVAGEIRRRLGIG